MKDIIKSVIVEFQQRELPLLKRRLIDIRHDIPMITTLIGSRRSGKTYLLYQVVANLYKLGVDRRNVLFINFEDDRLNFTSVADLDLIIQSFTELYPDIKLSETYFFFDEIQNVVGWERFVRRIFDNYSKHIFVTGSNSRLLSTEIASSLRGRNVVYTVYPLCFKEFLEFLETPYNVINPQNRSLVLAQSKRFITQGGFPEVIGFDDNTRTNVLQNYFNTMMYRDIVERYSINDVTLFRFFLKKIFANITKPLSINKIYNELKSQGYKISNNYLYDYEQYAYAVFLCVAISKFDFSEIKQFKSEKKSYAIDTGLLGAIEFSMSANLGKLLENAVLLELIKAGKEVYYYKNKSECDFLIRNQDGTLLPVQVSWDMTDIATRKRELKGIAEVCNNLSLSKGLIITFDEKENIVHNNLDINILPFYQWAYELRT